MSANGGRPRHSSRQTTLWVARKGLPDRGTIKTPLVDIPSHAADPVFVLRSRPRLIKRLIKHSRVFTSTCLAAYEDDRFIEYTTLSVHVCSRHPSLQIAGGHLASLA